MEHSKLKQGPFHSRGSSKCTNYTYLAIAPTICQFLLPLLVPSKSIDSDRLSIDLKLSAQSKQSGLFVVLSIKNVEREAHRHVKSPPIKPTNAVPLNRFNCTRQTSILITFLSAVSIRFHSCRRYVACRLSFELNRNETVNSFIHNFRIVRIVTLCHDSPDKCWR